MELLCNFFATNQLLLGMIIGFAVIAVVANLLTKVRIIYMKEDNFRNTFNYLSDYLYDYDNEWFVLKVNELNRRVNDFPTTIKRRVRL